MVQASSEVWRTWWLQMPVDYGSTFANFSFLFVLEIHAFALLLAFIAGMIALCAKKGKYLHIESGKVFYYGMLFGAITGIIIDLFRIFINPSKNHIKYDNFSMPLSYAARMAFLYAGLSTISMLINAVYGKNIKATSLPKYNAYTCTYACIILYIFPIILVLWGLLSVVIIFFKYDIFGGDIVMIITFMMLNTCNIYYWHEQMFSTKYNKLNTSKVSGILLHGFNMCFLAAFCAWAAFKGHFLGLYIWFKQDFGNDHDMYVGDRHDPTFNMNIVAYCKYWVPFYVVAWFLYRKFKQQIAIVYNQAKVQ